ncbi:MAG TPA: hypothetical protein V6C65_30755 [Allocoleopsis sp.]
MMSPADHCVESAQGASAAGATGWLSLLQQFMKWMSNAAGDLATVVAAKRETGEPKVFQIRGQSGELFWQIDDARTGSRVYCASAEEALEYLDRSEWM